LSLLDAPSPAKGRLPDSRPFAFLWSVSLVAEGVLDPPHRGGVPQPRPAGDAPARQVEAVVEQRIEPEAGGDGAVVAEVAGDRAERLPRLPFAAPGAVIDPAQGRKPPARPGERGQLAGDRGGGGDERRP